jgi:hypothetical protein
LQKWKWSNVIIIGWSINTDPKLIERTKLIKNW